MFETPRGKLLGALGTGGAATIAGCVANAPGTGDSPIKMQTLAVDSEFGACADKDIQTMHIPPGAV